MPIESIDSNENKDPNANGFIFAENQNQEPQTEDIENQENSIDGKIKKLSTLRHDYIQAERKQADQDEIYWEQEAIGYQLADSLDELMSLTESMSEEQFESFFLELNFNYSSNQIKSDGTRELMLAREFKTWDKILVSNAEKLTDIACKRNKYPANFLSLLRIRYLEQNPETDQSMLVAIRNSYEKVFKNHYQKRKSSFLVSRPRYAEHLIFYLDNIDSSLASDCEDIVEKAFNDDCESCNNLNDPFDDNRKIYQFYHFIDYRLLGALANTDNPKINEAIKDFLAQYDLNWQELKKSWSTTSLRNGRSLRIGENLCQIANLELSEPGICAGLRKEFGIEFFSRYDQSLLIKQWQNKNKQVPYGIVIYPKTDWNGAFYSDADLLSYLSERIAVQSNPEKETQLRIVEANGKFGVAKRLLRLEQKYGKQNKISFAIIGGHGTPESIQFGEPRQDIDQTLIDDFRENEAKGIFKNEMQAKYEMGRYYAHSFYVFDLFGQGASRLGGFFVKNPTIILHSCSTGATAGIAQEMSAKYGAKLIAPDCPTHITAIIPIKKPGSTFDFKVEFFDKGTTKEYVKGERQ